MSCDQIETLEPSEISKIPDGFLSDSYIINSINSISNGMYDTDNWKPNISLENLAYFSLIKKNISDIYSMGNLKSRLISYYLLKMSLFSKGRYDNSFPYIDDDSLSGYEDLMSIFEYADGDVINRTSLHVLCVIYSEYMLCKSDLEKSIYSKVLKKNRITADYDLNWNNEKIPFVLDLT